mmetsp:Transcript_3237/g.20109  ORF Transcript_3237/g.20109 Transcript_3237/m.20109 type:complete len:343 (+) Transcript_3237:3813-4841(+)
MRFSSMLLLSLDKSLPEAGILATPVCRTIANTPAASWKYLAASLIPISLSRSVSMACWEMVAPRLKRTAACSALMLRSAVLSLVLKASFHTKNTVLICSSSSLKGNLVSMTLRIRWYLFVPSVGVSTSALPRLASFARPRRRARTSRVLSWPFRSLLSHARRILAGVARLGGPLRTLRLRIRSSSWPRNASRLSPGPRPSLSFLARQARVPSTRACCFDPSVRPCRRSEHVRNPSPLHFFLAFSVIFRRGKDRGGARGRIPGRVDGPTIFFLSFMVGRGRGASTRVAHVGIQRLEFASWTLRRSSWRHHRAFASPGYRVSTSCTSTCHNTPCKAPNVAPATT